MIRIQVRNGSLLKCPTKMIRLCYELARYWNVSPHLGLDLVVQVSLCKLVTQMSHQMVRLWLVRHLNYVIVNRAKAILLKKRRLTVSPNVSPNLTPECDTFVLWASSLLKRLTKPCDPNLVVKWLVTTMSHQNDTFVLWASSLLKYLTEWYNSVTKSFVTKSYHQSDTNIAMKTVVP